MTTLNITSKKKKCTYCGLIKEVYAYDEVDYEEVDHLDKDDLLIEAPEKPLRDDDVVGLPCCKECYYENRGEPIPKEEASS